MRFAVINGQVFNLTTRLAEAKAEYTKGKEPVTAADLRKAERAYQRATARTEELRIERNRLVLEALAGGWTHQAIKDATGLSRGRISQIKKDRS